MSKVIQGRSLATLLLDENVESIPFYVILRIVEDETDLAEQDETRKDVKAHKFVLAANSPVFRGMFYGPLKETREIIPVKQTTFEAFKRLVEFFYQVKIDGSYLTILEIFELLN